MKLVGAALLLSSTAATQCPATDVCDGDCSGEYDGYATSTLTLPNGDSNLNKADLHASLDSSVRKASLSCSLVLSPWDGFLFRCLLTARSHTYPSFPPPPPSLTHVGLLRRGS